VLPNHFQNVIGCKFVSVHFFLLLLPLELLPFQHLILLSLIIKNGAYPLLYPCLSIVLQLACTLINHILSHDSLCHSHIILLPHRSRLLPSEADLSSPCRSNIIDKIVRLHISQFGPSIVVNKVLFCEDILKVFFDLVQMNVLVLMKAITDQFAVFNHRVLV
jgi:hypothetical protein